MQPLSAFLISRVIYIKIDMYIDVQIKAYSLVFISTSVPCVSITPQLKFQPTGRLYDVIARQQQGKLALHWNVLWGLRAPEPASCRGQRIGPKRKSMLPK